MCYVCNENEWGNALICWDCVNDIEDCVCEPEETEERMHKPIEAVRADWVDVVESFGERIR